MSITEEEYQALIQEDMAVEENSGSRTTVITPTSADVLRQLEIMQMEIKQLLEQQQQQQCCNNNYNSSSNNNYNSSSRKTNQDQIHTRGEEKGEDEGEGEGEGEGVSTSFIATNFFFFNLKGSFKNHHHYKRSHQ